MKRRYVIPTVWVGLIIATVFVYVWAGRHSPVSDQQIVDVNTKQQANESQQVTLFSPMPTPQTIREESDFIQVAVATLWKEPNQQRIKDQPSLSAPVQLDTWLKPLSNPDKLWFVGKLETQVLFGQQVEVLEERGEWVKIAVSNQQTAKNSKGYPGWLPKSQLLKSREYAPDANHTFIRVKGRSAALYDQSHSMQSDMEISFNTKLPVMQMDEANDRIQVSTPLGEKWISRYDVTLTINSQEIPQVKGNDLVETAKQFLGLPYLWSGTSGFGFDCSGFTYTIHQFHGLEIPRDAAEQAKAGTAVSKSQMQPGDLLFFAHNQGKGNVHHVAMYVGDGKMIHSPKTGKTVEIVPIETSDYAGEYAASRRFYKP